MVSLPLMARLLEAVDPSAALVLVGDPGQLDSVENGSVLRDLTGLMKGGEGGRELERVVLVRFGPARVLGFVTQENANVPGLGTDESLVAVYLPMSYQIGGYTLYLPRDRIQPTDLTVEAAMRIVLTGGLQTQ